MLQNLLIMKHYLLLFLSISCVLLLTACLGDDEPKDTVKEIRMSVSAETGVTYPLFDDKREHPIECMLVMTEDYPGVWQPMTFGTIEGFTYERGHEYYLSVRKTTLANPPADGAGCTYKLLRILDDRLVVEPETPVDKDITSIDDIEYQALCPFDKYAIESLYYIDGNGKITYSYGDSAPGYDRARIYIENVLPKDDPNWTKFQSVPYMAIYSFVFSPLSEEIRLVRNESSGPMFRDVVPEEEYRYIVDGMQPGDELLYTLVLANVHKLALQQLSFKIKKR
ncbi:MAG: DUF4377 domain-containing protein [Muribaculaceae bacterium]|nr:DUF4377 domain-containing protein [Muribaculaceae bacterium]